MIKKKTQLGFTLTEILITVIIVGLVASFAMPRYTAILEKSRSDEGRQTLLTVLSGQKQLFSEGGVYTSTLANLGMTFPASAYFAVPTVSTDPNVLGRIVRNAPFNYTLTINKDGVITCTGDTGGLCAKMGY